MRSFFSRACTFLALGLIVFGGLLPAAAVHAQQTLDERSWTDRALMMSNPITGLYALTQDAGARLGDYVYEEQPDVMRTVGGGLARGESATQIAQRALGLPTGGSITDVLTARLIGFLAFMMGIIVSFLGKVISLLINVLLGFLAYNGFADAPPVVIGWKIVRDLVNMFFIVILILSSYATILGWKRNELHVKDVLPKVLLAAVLVNFSKTIVALLIDASQVVMLTFVNAFAAIGAGNFTNALHLPLIAQSGYADQLQAAVSSTAQSVGTDGAGQVIIDVILASALQIFLLIVAIGVMMMMVVFVVARIVGLWMLLIFSPIPFLAEALPGSMKKAMPGVDDFWPRLTGLLTGGPIMAFWLWLTFATLSAQGADERLGLFSGSQALEVAGPNAFQVGQNVTSAFITRIGNAQGLGSYIIAIAMMMMGLEAAMAASSKVGESAGGLMKKIGNKSKDYASRAARAMTYGGVAAGVGLAVRGTRAGVGLTALGLKKGVSLAASGAFKGARGAVGLVDRRYDMSGGMARQLQKVPGLGRSEWLRGQESASRDAKIKKAMEKSKIMNDKWAPQSVKDAEYQRIMNDINLTGSPAARLAMADQDFKTASNEKAFDAELKPVKDGVKAGVEASTNGDKVVAKRVSDRSGKQQSNGRRLDKYESAKSLVDGDSQEAVDRRQQIEDAVKKINKENPHLILNEEERKKQMSEVRQNFGSLDQDAKANFEVLKNFAADGAFKTDANGRVTMGDTAAIRATQKKLTGNDRKNFDSLVSYVKESRNGVDTKTLAKLSVEQDANDQRRIFQADTDGAGKITGGKFVMSETRQDEVDKVVANFSAGNKGTWLTSEEVNHLDQPTVTAGKATELVNAAKTVGVSQAVRNVGSGASPSEAPTMRAAAVNSIAKSTAVGLGGANSYLSQPRTYQDASGADVTRTNAEILRDKNVPASVQARAAAEYQSKVNEVLPILNGMEELSGDEQIEFMAAMGQSNVGQALNSNMMRDPETRAAAQKLKMTVNENSEIVNSYLDSLPAQTKQDYDNFKQYTEYELKNPSTDPNVQAQTAGFQRLQAADADFRSEYFKQTPGAERSYNEYVRYEEAKAKVEPKHLEQTDGFSKSYSKYVKYDNARSAINQFNSNGGKGSNSAGRNRGGGGGGRRGGGGGAPTT